MEGLSRIRSSELSVCELPKVGFVRVVKVGLQVAEHRRHRIGAVICDGHGLRVAEFREGLHVEPKIDLGAVALRGRNVGLVRERFSCEQAYTGVVPTLGEVVTDLELVCASAQLARCPGGEIVRECEEYLRAESLQECAPRFTWQSGLERTDALGSDNWNALRLAGEAEELLIARRLAFTNGGEMLVLVTHE